MSTCEFQDITQILHRLVDGIKSNQVRDVLVQKGNLNLEKAIEMYRADEVTKKRLQLMLREKEIGKKNKTKFYQKKEDTDCNGTRNHNH